MRQESQAGGVGYGWADGAATTSDCNDERYWCTLRCVLDPLETRYGHSGQGGQLPQQGEPSWLFWTTPLASAWSVEDADKPNVQDSIAIRARATIKIVIRIVVSLCTAESMLVENPG